ncbi:MAG: hypothetical protein WC477_06465 [Patescibacteria group bacterium]
MKKLFKRIQGWLKHLAKIICDACIFAFMQVRKMPLRAIISLVIAAGFGFWLGPRAGALWLLFLLFLVYEWENRIVGVLALISLASCPFLLSFHQDDFAEIMAQYAYFFLVITVVLQIVEYKRNPGRGEGDN